MFDTEPNRILKIDAVADWLNVPPGTLRYWRHIGSGPRSAKLGRRVVYRAGDVQAWLDAQFAATGTDPTPTA